MDKQLYRLALITDAPLGEEAVLSGEKIPLSVVKGVGLGVSVVGKVIKLYKIDSPLAMINISQRLLHNLMSQQHERPPQKTTCTI